MIVYHVARRHNYCMFTYFMMCADSLYDRLGRTKKARASTRVCRRKPFTATQSPRTNSAKTCGRMERLVASPHGYTHLGSCVIAHGTVSTRVRLEFRLATDARCFGQWRTSSLKN